MGRSRFLFGESPFPHFLTCTVVGWLPVYSSARNYAKIEALVSVTTDW